jgi:hypothetical protein
LGAALNKRRAGVESKLVINEERHYYICIMRTSKGSGPSPWKIVGSKSLFDEAGTCCAVGHE